MKRQFKAINKHDYTVALTAGPPGTNGSFEVSKRAVTQISQMFKSSPVVRHNMVYVNNR